MEPFINWKINFANTRKRLRTTTARPARKSPPRKRSAKKKISEFFHALSLGRFIPAGPAWADFASRGLAKQPYREVARALAQQSGGRYYGGRQKGTIKAMKFSDFVSAGAIRANLRADDKQSAVREMVDA